MFDDGNGRVVMQDVRIKVEDAGARDVEELQTWLCYTLAFFLFRVLLVLFFYDYRILLLSLLYRSLDFVL